MDEGVCRLAAAGLVVWHTVCDGAPENAAWMRLKANPDMARVHAEGERFGTATGVYRANHNSTLVDTIHMHHLRSAWLPCLVVAVSVMPRRSPPALPYSCRRRPAELRGLAVLPASRLPRAPHLYADGRPPSEQEAAQQPGEELWRHGWVAVPQCQEGRCGEVATSVGQHSVVLNLAPVATCVLLHFPHATSLH